MYFYYGTHGMHHAPHVPACRIFGFFFATRRRDGRTFDVDTISLLGHVSRLLIDPPTPSSHTFLFGAGWWDVKDTFPQNRKNENGHNVLVQTKEEKILYSTRPFFVVVEEGNASKIFVNPTQHKFFVDRFPVIFRILSTIDNVVSILLLLDTNKHV